MRSEASWGTIGSSDGSREAAKPQEFRQHLAAPDEECGGHCWPLGHSERGHHGRFMGYFKVYKWDIQTHIHIICIYIHIVTHVFLKHIYEQISK